ncbi:hypothetical protein SEEACDC2_13289, partial [Salmonella enterica subsp. enterica serovar Agona str. SA-2]
PPLTAIFKLRAVQKYGLFAYMYPPNQGGSENHRPGFDTKTPGAFLNRACSGPEGARPRDGLSSGAASWTDRARSERAARRASAASQSPLTAIFKKELVRKYGLFVSKLIVFTVIFLMIGLFLDLWLLHQTYYRLCKTAPVPYLKRFRKVCISISR